VLTGPYEITRLLPLEAGFHITGPKNVDGRERALSELSLRLMPEAADRNGTQAARSKSRRR
jgi:hypothetical protein